MRDNISLARLNMLHPKAIPIFKKFIEDAETALDITLRIVQGGRTFAEQQAIYDQGRTKPGKIVSNAVPGSSYHNYGLAIDLGHLINNGTEIDWHFEYDQLLKYMPHDMTWGGNFHSIKDYPHFELQFGYSWRDLLAKYNAQNFIDGTEYVNI